MELVESLNVSKSQSLKVSTEQKSQMSQGEGNTKPPQSTKDHRSRKWCMTLNNYSEDEFTELHQFFRKKKWNFIIGKEVGTSGTSHLQMYVSYKNQIRFGALKTLNPKMHIEVARGSETQNYEYCSKDGDFVTNIVPKTPKHIAIQQHYANVRNECMKDYANVEWRPWQKQVLEILKTKPDSRTIHWFWEDKGNVGKSFLCKYIYLKYGDECIIADGKKDNVFNAIKTCMDNLKIPKIVIMDIPRDYLKFVNYGAIESIKNGLIYSGKYEGGVCAFKHPHVIAFANIRPVCAEWSEDRLKVYKIE